MNSADEDLSGSLVGGKYMVDKKIQNGYYGTTWLARDTRTNGEVCLKTFFRENTSQKKELDNLKKLSEGNFCHGNLCAILDVCADRAPVCDWRGDIVGGVQYVVFEYCRGSDLFNFLVTGPYERAKKVSGFPEPLARHYFTQTLLAVMYLHERRVFHRDIKPENCVLDHNFNLKLTDFGTNKFLPASSEPGQLLRASTKKVGTDSYRAPEVDSGEEYDPSAADVWSLGVTLFFMVAVEVMVSKARTLDPYLKPLLAPLGIFFPFPYQCKLLDSYLKNDTEIAAAKSQRNVTVSQLFPNPAFWEEWAVLGQAFSPQLLDFFNCMFVLSPAHRVVLRDLARHPWVSSGVTLSPEEITHQMNSRSPGDLAPNVHASPSVMAKKLLGGVDQAILRQTLSSHGNMATSSEYLSDSEVWVLTDQIRTIEGLQIDMACSDDIQNFMIDISLVRQVLVELLRHPDSERSRSVLYSEIRSSWITQLLFVVGFLPHNRLLYLMRDRFDPALTGHTLEVLEGIEFAVSRDVIKVNHTDLDEMGEEAMDEDVDGNVFSRIGAQTTLPHTSDSGGAVSASYSSNRMEEVAMDHAPHPPRVIRRRSSSEPISSPTARTPLGSMDPQSSQDSCWTSYTNGASLSTQSSQEELPEAMLEPASLDSAHSYQLLPLSTTVDRHKPFQFKCAGEFCKMSGLLCSHGYYQVVICGQLALYCRGNTTSFSARVVFLEDIKGSIGISSWCFHGHDEWRAIMERLRNDMQCNK